MIFKLSQLNTLMRSTLSGSIAFVFYGGWAYFSNSAHGAEAALKSLCLQGSYSFFLTFFMTVFIEVVYQNLAKIIPEIWSLHRWATVVLVCSLVFSLSWWLNIVAGTPEVFRTVALGYIVGGIYTVMYVFSLDYEMDMDDMP